MNGWTAAVWIVALICATVCFIVIAAIKMGVGKDKNDAS